MENRVKVLLGVQDGLQDESIQYLVENVESHLGMLLGKEVPSYLNYIVEEIAISRFNRLGTEGMKSEAVEGHSVTFYDLDTEFIPYYGIIDKEKDEDDGISRGKVIFI